MKEDGPDALFDPPLARWDRLFQKDIHGVLKVAGSDQDRLKEIKKLLGYGSGVIEDIDAKSAPTETPSRWTGRAALRNTEGFAWGREQ